VVPGVVCLRSIRTCPILSQDRPRLEDVASGYWTLFIKQSSGLGHRSLDFESVVLRTTTRRKASYVINSVLTGNFAEPRLTSGAFAFLESIAENPRAGKIRNCGLSRATLRLSLRAGFLKKREKWSTPS
jgi:hypothetical protein